MTCNTPEKRKHEKLEVTSDLDKVKDAVKDSLVDSHADKRATTEEVSKDEDFSDKPSKLPETSSDPAKPIPKALLTEEDVESEPVVSGYYTIKNFELFQKWLIDYYPVLPETTSEEATEPTKVLVLDMDDTLVCHSYADKEVYSVSSEDGRQYYQICHRTGLNRFLNVMSKTYRSIVIYTSASKVYANQIISKINERYAKEYPETTSIISEALYCEDCVLDSRERRKDLLKVPGVTNLDDVVFVDDDPYYAFLSQDDNILHIPKFKYSIWDEKADDWLLLYTPLLAHLSQAKSVPEKIKTLKKMWNLMGMLKTVTSTLPDDFW